MKEDVQSATVADSPNVVKGDRAIKPDTHAYIAYIAGRLISGKRIAILYDYTQARQIEITSLPDVDCIKEFDYEHRNYIPGYASGCNYQYSCSTGHTIDISINGTAFMGYIRGTASYFIGNVRGDSIYLFDYEESIHINYSISGCMVERNNRTEVCTICWLTR